MNEVTEVKETALSQREIYQGRIVRVHEDTVRLPDGRTATREVVEHADGAAVLALDERNNVLTVSQYRYVLGKTLQEIPAGKLDPGEDPLSGALRELQEETGAIPETVIPLGRILPSPGCFSEVLHLFLARGFTLDEPHPDKDEFLHVERVPFAEMVHRCINGEIEDAKTVAAVLRAKILLNL